MRGNLLDTAPMKSLGHFKDIADYKEIECLVKLLTYMDHINHYNYKKAVIIKKDDFGNYTKVIL